MIRSQFSIILAVVMLFMLPYSYWTGGASAQEVPSSDPLLRIKKVDLLLIGYLPGLFPQNRMVGGSSIPNTDVRGTIGAGIKFDVHPWFTNKILGAEIEAFGLGGRVRAPRTTSGAGTPQGT